ALAAPGAVPTGEIIVSGSDTNAAVTLDGQPVMSGRTFLGSGIIATPETRSATVNLGSLGRVSLSPNSILSLTLGENSIGGELIAGNMQVFNKAGVAVNIKTKDNQVTNNAEQPGDFSIDVRSGETVSTIEKGEIYMATGQPTAAQLTDAQKRALWIVVPVVAAVIIIAVVASDDDDFNNFSPVR
ncbi:MAG TPA: hypothetical protein VNA17_04810, partial [Pyrinomonadaceae bacterium]|nr:hypothetical protein [Pyrinomonadaceae bacterium]